MTSSDTDRPIATARDALGPSPLAPIDNEPQPRLIVDPPLAAQLEKGLVFIQYRTENLRVMPVFGEAALAVSPRIGHVHITVDDAPWHFIETSGETVVVVGLEAGTHSILFELADPNHRVIARHTVKFHLPRGKDGQTTWVGSPTEGNTEEHP